MHSTYLLKMKNLKKIFEDIYIFKLLMLALLMAASGCETTSLAALSNDPASPK